MNILFATSANPFGSEPIGGAETSCRRLAEKLAERGHNVIYVCNRADRRSKRVAKQKGIGLFSLPPIRGTRLSVIRTLAELRWEAAILFLCLLRSVDIIYCLYELHICEAAIRVRERRQRPKVVVRMAGIYWWKALGDDGGKRYLMGRYEKMFNNADAVNYVSAGLVDLCKSKFDDIGMSVSTRYEFVCDIGFEMPFPIESNYENRLREPFKILMAGRFAEYAKRQDILINAAHMFENDNLIQIILVGSGPKEAYLKALTEQLGVEKRVEFVPFMPQQELIMLMQQANLLCHACDFEGMPKVVVEAMHSGLPVLASDVAPINGLIEDGVNGFLVENEPECWAKRITELVGNYRALADVSARAHDFALSELDATRCVVDFEKEFQRLVACPIEVVQPEC